MYYFCFFFFQAEDGIRDIGVTGVQTCALPILLLMTAASSDDREQLEGYAHGAVDFLRKPIVPEILRTKVSVFVDLYLTRETMRRQEAQLRAREREALESAHREHLHDLLMQAPAAIEIG